MFRHPQRCRAFSRGSAAIVFPLFDMTSTTSRQAAIDELLGQLRDASPATYNEAELTLPAIRVHGEEVTHAWLMACRRLSDYDREGGKAFARGSREAEKVSETVLPWTEQALQFLRWKNAWRALEGFMANLPRAYGSLGHAGQRRWAEIGFLWCGRQVESGNAYFATPVVELSGRHGITGIEHVWLMMNIPFELAFDNII
jgi:hypothetical protein